jgi:hypothetical protein
VSLKILFWDIETAPLVVTSWDLRKPFLTHKNIVSDTQLLCAAWKWLGHKAVHGITVKSDKPGDDRPVVAALRDVISQADVIVAHNGDKFDLRRLNARIAFHGLGPMAPPMTIDTLKVARKYFAFTSNRLDYLGKFLGVGRKIGTDFDLWLRAMAGDKKALVSMLSYNKQDVKLLEDVYLKLRPFMTNHPNSNLVDSFVCCPTCSSRAFTLMTDRLYRSVARHQYRCRSCGAWFVGDAVKTSKVK